MTPLLLISGAPSVFAPFRNPVSPSDHQVLETLRHYPTIYLPGNLEMNNTGNTNEPGTVRKLSTSIEGTNKLETPEMTKRICENKWEPSEMTKWSEQGINKHQECIYQSTQMSQNIPGAK